MEKIRDARSKAEEYLLGIVNRSWNNEASIEQDNHIPHNWPLQFEAHVYLGHKYKNFIPEYAIKIRNLWLNWVKCYESQDNGYGRFKYFWPAIDKFLVPEDHENAKSDEGHEIETHIVMFRAKENLQIIGFDTYFNEAKRRLGDLLLEDQYYYGKKIRILWQIIRCPYLCKLLQDYIKTITQKLFEERKINNIFRDENDNSREDSNFLSKMSFFLIISNLKEDYRDNAQRILLRLIDMQDEKGSFFNDILSTCLIISTLEILNLDSLKIISERAIDWILNEQTTQGSWPHPQISWSYDTPELDILSTVLVLETFDLVTNNKVLPLWAEKSRFPKPIIQERNYTRIKTIVPFKTPGEVNWHDITIRFISEEVVQIRAGSASEGRDFKAMGFEFRDLNRPDLVWESLKEFGKHQGEISFYDKNINPKIKDNLKYNVYVLKIRLKELFGIKNAPFYPYDRKKKLYKARFNIRFDI